MFRTAALSFSPDASGSRFTRYCKVPKNRSVCMNLKASLHPLSIWNFTVISIRFWLFLCVYFHIYLQVKPSCHSPQRTQSNDIINCNKNLLFHMFSPDGASGLSAPAESSASLCLTRVFNSLHLVGGFLMLFIVSQLHDRVKER